MELTSLMVMTTSANALHRLFYVMEFFLNLSFRQCISIVDYYIRFRFSSNSMNFVCLLVFLFSIVHMNYTVISPMAQDILCHCMINAKKHCGFCILLSKFISKSKICVQHRNWHETQTRHYLAHVVRMVF